MSARAAVVLALVLVAVLPGQTRSRDASIGVWPWLVGNVDAYATEIVDRAKRTGLDTIYLHIWRTMGARTGEMHIADEAGTWSTRNGALIPQVTVSSFVSKAHAAGLQVVGVVQVFRDGVVLPSDYAHQDFIIGTVIRYLVHSYRPTGERVYPLDGIALDYVRWFGGSHTGREVERFLDELRREVGPLPLHAYLPAGAFAIDGSTYDNQFRTYAAFRSYVVANYGQDWEAMARRLDCILPMAYTCNGHVYGTNLAYMEGYLRQVARYARTAVGAARSPCRVVPAVRTWNSTGETTTQATVEACCRGAMAGGADGFMAFRYFTARGQSTWFDGLANHSVAGPDRPVVAFAAQVNGVQVTTDTTGSWHSKFGTGALTAHLDLDGDGTFETGPLPVGRRTQVLPRVGVERVAARVTDPNGFTAVSIHRVSSPDILTPAAATVSVGQGGRVDLRLAAGAAHGGQRYIVFGSLAGTTPGTPLGNVVVPLRVDLFTEIVYGSVNTAMFPGFAGTLDGQGGAAPAFVLPANVVPWYWAGTKLYFAAVGVDRTSGVPLFASNPAVVTLGR